ncbi:histidine phosphatase family protein [Sphingomonas bacterium]|uniref:histidine phosphatase family protein n=1 Tax=Sphingomonas bacterium TaxID=1895847 RepID=UPI0015770667|nr:histidine phosphatase family protein [Sphingomonas bacterium]
MISFYLVRHGNTFPPGVPAVRIGSASDLPLTEEGERQATALGEWFTNLGIAFDRVLAGSLKRTRRTAELIVASLQPSPPVQVADWLTEIDHGEDEGKPDDLIAARVGAAALRAWDEQALAPAGWQVAAEARIAAWRHLFAERPRGDVLLVTSNGAARFALLACSMDRPSSLKLRTGAFGQIIEEPSGALRVAAWDVRPPQR